MADGEVRNGVGSGSSKMWVSFVKENLKKFSCSKEWEQESSLMFRVGSRLKKVKPQHFNHAVMSLGLYDRSNDELNSAMTEGNKFRLTVVSAFLHDIHKTDDWDIICGQVVEHPEDMQQLYDDLHVDLDADGVKSMLALDALFLACVLGCWYSPAEKFSSRFPSVMSAVEQRRWDFLALLMDDFMKLENQIPLVLVRKAFTFMIKMSQVEPGVDVVEAEVEAVEPGADVVELEVEAVQPEVDAVEPEVEAVQPGVEPGVEAVELGVQPGVEPGVEPGVKEWETVCAVLVGFCLSYVPGFSSYNSIPVKYSDFCFPGEECTHLLDCLYKGATRCGLTQNTPEENETLLDCLWRWLSRQKSKGAVAHQSQNFEHNGGEISVPLATQDVGGDVESPVPLATQLVDDRAEISMPSESETLFDRIWRLLSRQKRRGAAAHQSDKFEYNEIQFTVASATLLVDDRAEIPVPSATQLVDVGVEFHGRTGGLCTPEFKVHRWRDKATLFLPKLDQLGDNSEIYWRNLLAYESSSETCEDPLLMGYFILMDGLIDDEKDVAILKTGKHPVIGINGLGNDAEVASLFNSITTNLTFDQPHEWKKIRMDIHKYFNNDKRKTRVEFMKTYFGKWWLTASLLAAFVLLVMTLLQTVFTILSYNKT